MMYIKEKRYQQGFTLLELMIVAAVIAILAGLAYPSYLDSIQKSRRADAFEALLDCASAQTRFFSRESPSTYLDGANAQGQNLCGWNGTDFISQDEHYTLAFENDNCERTLANGAVIFSCFTVTATAEPSQIDDLDCRTFVIDERGNREAFDAGGVDTTELCWRN